MQVHQGVTGEAKTQQADPETSGNDKKLSKNDK